MRSDQNPFPIHNLVISAFKKNPAKGEQTLIKVLKHEKTTLISKLQLMARLLGEVGEKEASLVISSLPPQQQLPEYIPQLSLESPQKLEALINFLITRTLLNSTVKNSLYAEIARTYNTKHQDYHSVIYFLKLRLNLASIPVTTRHSTLMNLGRCCLNIDDAKESEFYYNEAMRLEASGKLNAKYVQDNGVINSFLKGFQDSQEIDFNNPCINNLSLAYKFAPNHPAVIKSAASYIDRGLVQSKKDCNTDMLRQMVMIVTNILPLSDRITDIMPLILKAPAEKINCSTKAKCFLIAKQYDKAIELARLSLRKEPFDPYTLHTLAGALCEQNKFKEASQTLTDLLKLKVLPPDILSNAYGMLAEINSRLGNHGKAVHYAEESLKLNQNDIKTPLNLAINYARMGQDKKAKLILQEAKHRFPSENMVDEVRLQIFPEKVNSDINENASPHILCGEVHYHIRHQEYGIARKKAALIEKHDGCQAIAHRTLAQICSIEKNYLKALEHLQHASIYTDSTSLAAEFMRIYGVLQHYPQAEEQAWIVLRIVEPSLKNDQRFRLDAYRVLYAAYYNTQRYSEGINRLTEVLQQESLAKQEKQQLHYYLAFLHLLLKNTQAAEDHAYQAVHISPQDAPTKIYILLGSLYFGNDKQHLAIEVLEKGTEANPEDAELFLELGYAYYSCNTPIISKAIECFSRVLALNPAYLGQISEKLPLEIVEKLHANHQEPTSKTDCTQQAKTTDSTITIPACCAPLSLKTAVVTSSTRTDSSPLPEEKKSTPVIFTPEQIVHRLIEAEKKRLKYNMENQDLADELAENGWDVPQVGFVPLSDCRVAKVAMAHHTQSSSHLYAFLNTNKLKQSCENQLLNKWQSIISQGKVVGKQGQQGIRLLNSAESAKIANHIGLGYVAKLKILGTFGNSRAYARLIPAQMDAKDQLLCFDTALTKSHR